MLTRDFDFDLPQELIAQQPKGRGESRLLDLDAVGEERHRSIADLPHLLAAGDLLVVNDTRVIPARLFAHRPKTGGKVELLLVEKRSETTWNALVKPGRKARPGTLLELDDGPRLEVIDKAPGGLHLLRFSEPIEPHLDRLGHIPLPPYIKRPDTAADRERYQTLFARDPGAIAAPTAGLHFSRELLAALEQRGVRRAAVTLHVGIGTFKPVTAELAHEHVMDHERWRVSHETVEAVRTTRAAGGRVVAVGTTVVRALESAALAASGEGAAGEKAAGEETPEENKIVSAGEGATDLFIRPGFRFRAVDALLTNFHLPCSTLLMLVSAFAGQDRVLAAYREAIERRYRFYSYGDAMLVRRAEDGGSR